MKDKVTHCLMDVSAVWLLVHAMLCVHFVILSLEGSLRAGTAVDQLNMSLH